MSVIRLRPSGHQVTAEPSSLAPQPAHGLADRRCRVYRWRSRKLQLIGQIMFLDVGPRPIRSHMRTVMLPVDLQTGIERLSG